MVAAASCQHTLLTVAAADCGGCWLSICIFSRITWQLADKAATSLAIAATSSGTMHTCQKHRENTGCNKPEHCQVVGMLLSAQC
jgi:hypothetical protein